jgi:hypothetical protein
MTSPHINLYIVFNQIKTGSAMAWLGLALFTERREKSAKAVHDLRTVSPEASKVACDC